MRKFKKLALSLLLAIPMVVSAAGMGVYVPLSAGDSGSYTVSPDYTSYEYDVDSDFKSAAGFGLAFDSNIGKDKLFNYRLGLEYQNLTHDGCSGYGCDVSRFNMVNTFGFGVVRTRVVRLWVGPRINVAWNYNSEDYTTSGGYTNTYTEAAFELGIAPAVGINVNLGKVVSLAFDADYRFAAVGGAWDDGEFDSGSYSGTVKGLTARFYVLFRFSESFEPRSAVTQDQGVVDQSL